MNSTAEQLRSLYSPQQLQALDVVREKLKEDPKALEPVSEKSEK